MIYRLFIVLTISVSFNALAKITITTLGPQKANDPSHDYFIGLINRVIQHSDELSGATIEQVPNPGQKRVLKMMAKGFYWDIVWSGSSKERDTSLRKIAFPLFKGGLGWRGLIIKQQELHKFNDNITLEQLKQLYACQGMHWPDADILEKNGFNLYRVGHFDAMLEMVALGRCDYLPLSIFEGKSELGAMKDKYPELVFITNIIIQYPMTMNFYVHKNNEPLAKLFEQALITLDQQQQITLYMQHHPLTSNAFPLTQYKNAKVFRLKNDNLNDSALDRFGLELKTLTSVNYNEK